MYNIKIEFSKKELNEIMEEMEQAQEKIFECWKRLENMGVAVVRESGQPNERSEALEETGSSEEAAKKLKQLMTADLHKNNIEFEYKNVMKPLALEEKAPELKLCKAVSRERKRNHLTITIEAEEPMEAKALFENLRKAIRKENRLLLGNISYEVDCKVRKNDTSLNT